MRKVVNGIEVDCTAEEIAALETEWSEAQTKRVAEVAETRTKERSENLNSLLRKAAKDKINSFDMAKIQDAELRELLVSIRILLSKWN